MEFHKAFYYPTSFDLNIQSTPSTMFSGCLVYIYLAVVEITIICHFTKGHVWCDFSLVPQNFHLSTVFALYTEIQIYTYKSWLTIHASYIYILIEISKIVHLFTGQVWCDFHLSV